MAKTNTEKIDELGVVVASLIARLDGMGDVVAQLADLQTRVALLEHKVNQLEKNADRWQSVRDKILFIILGAIITLIVKHFWP